LAAKHKQIEEETSLLNESVVHGAITVIQDRIQRNKNNFVMKLLQKQNDERWKRESTTKVEEEQFAMRCRCCSALMCMSTDVRRIKESQYAVLSRQFDSGIAAVRRERRELRSGVGKIMCQSCGQDLGNVGHFQGAQFPMIKLRSFVLEDVYGHHFVIAKWKNSPFLVAALSQTELQERIVSSIQLLPSFK